VGRCVARIGGVSPAKLLWQCRPGLVIGTRAIRTTTKSRLEMGGFSLKLIAEQLGALIVPS
jgi:hypothetical protein